MTQRAIDSVFDEARQVIINAPPFSKAINSAPKGLDEYRTATARAIVAQAIWASENVLPIIAINADLRDNVR